MHENWLNGAELVHHATIKNYEVVNRYVYSLYVK